MEESIQNLRERNLQVSIPLTLPNEDELVEIEEALISQLPADLRMFLLEVSDVVYGSLEPVTVTDPQSHTYLPEVAAVAWDHGVSRELIPICQKGHDYYCMDMEDEIVLWSNGEVDEETWSSIWHWTKDVWLES